MLSLPSIKSSTSELISGSRLIGFSIKILDFVIPNIFLIHFSCNSGVEQIQIKLTSVNSFWLLSSLRKFLAPRLEELNPDWFKIVLTFWPHTPEPSTKTLLI